MVYQKIVIPDEKRIFFVGDIHGEFDLYLKGCKDLGITSEDVVISVGDLVDRGDKNFATVAEFTRKANRYAVKGNHEDLMIKGFLEGSRQHFECWFMNGGSQTFEEVGEQGVYALSEMCKDLPVILEIEWNGINLGVVHGGIPYFRQSSNWDEIVIEAHNDSQYEESLVWDRNVIDSIQRNLKVGYEMYKVPPLTGIDYVFHGHTPLRKPLVEGNRVYIDTGGVFNSKLTFAYFENNKLDFYTTGDFDE